MMKKTVWLFSFLWLFFCLPTQANTHIDDGLAWLKAQYQTDGSYQSGEDITLPFQATAETLITFNLLNESIAPESLIYLNATDFRNTENLAKLIQVNPKGSAARQAAIDALLTHVDLDTGALGDFAGYDGTVLDTAIALEALADTYLMDTNDFSPFYPTIDYLLQQQTQNSSGYWYWSDNDNEGSVYTTAITMQALLPYKNAIYNVPNLDIAATLDDGVRFANHVIVKYNYPLFEKTLAILALYAHEQREHEINNWITYLQNQQQINGSWDNDVYTTALVLRTLHLLVQPELNPNLGSILGSVVDGYTQEPQSLISVMLIRFNGQIILGEEDSIKTDEQGQFNLPKIEPGVYHLKIGDFLETRVELLPGQNLDIGTLQYFFPPDDGEFIIYGVVSDREGSPLANADISIEDQNSALYFSTDERGHYFADDLTICGSSCNISITVEKAGYLSQQYNLGDISDNKIINYSLSLVTRMLTLEGEIISSKTQLPLANVEILLNGELVANTDENGQYTYEKAPFTVEGEELSLELSAHLSGYHDMESTLVIADNSQTKVVFSPPMTPLENDVVVGETRKLTGVIKDRITQQPIANMPVTLLSSSNPSPEYGATNANGEFEFINIGGEQLWINAGYILEDYTYMSFDLPEFPVNVEIDIGTIFISPANNTKPFNVVGMVVDMLTNKPLAGATVIGQFGDNTITTTTDMEGQFELADVTATKASITIELEDYETVNTDFNISELSSSSQYDIQKIPLQPQDVSAHLADLSVTALDLSQLQHDPQTLQLTGEIRVDIANLNDITTTQPIEVMAFYDANHNRRYDLATDVVLNTISLDDSFHNAMQATVSLIVDTTLPYRDAPVWIWVDSAYSTVESNEVNNLKLLNQQCHYEAENITFDMLEVGNYSFSVNYGAYTSRVTAAPLMDKNGDGVINQHDSADIVLLKNDDVDSTITVLDGSDLSLNTKKWSLTNVFKLYTSYHLSGPTVGDIDNDGELEILFMTRGTMENPEFHSGLAAIESDGSIKWHVEARLPHGATDPTSVRQTLSNRVPILADLNGDGQVEVFMGGDVFNAENGEILWSVPIEFHFGDNETALIADMNLDNVLDIIISSHAYSGKLDNEVLFTVLDKGCGHNYSFACEISATHSALANLDNDLEPEIIVPAYTANTSLIYNFNASTGELEHQFLSSASSCGTPAVADFDGDSLPEIAMDCNGVVQMFEHDGTLKWSRSHQEHQLAGGGSGAAAFDFNYNGRAEVVFMTYFSIYILDGITGDILGVAPYQSDLNAITIVDLDADGHAEILVPYIPIVSSGSSSGIRVYQNRQNRWAPTRNIWNQSSNYYINNINDDGSIPTPEQASNHDTFSYAPSLNNTFAGQPDLSIGALNIVDAGRSQGFNLTTTVANAGFYAIDAITVRYYQGTPEQGIELGVINLPRLSPGAHQQINLNNANITDYSQPIYAVVGSDNSECNTNNNQVSTALDSLPYADVTISTDAEQYTAQTDANISIDINNTGHFPTAFNIETRVEDNLGNLIETLGTHTTETLALDQNTQHAYVWDTAQYFTGGYQVHTILTSLDGTVINEQTKPFTIVPDSLPVIEMSSRTDKPIYHREEVFLVTTTLQNHSFNYPVDDTMLKTRFYSTDYRGVIHSNSTSVATLMPQSLMQLHILHQIPSRLLGTIGEYHIEIDLVDSDDKVLATEHLTFEMGDILELNLSGNVQAEYVRLNQGDIQTCSYNVSKSTYTPNKVHSIQELVVNLDNLTIIQQYEDMITFNNYSPLTLESQIVDTQAFSPGYYACVLQYQDEGEWHTLDFERFRIEQNYASQCNHIYAVHDQDEADSQLFTYNLDNGNITPLGALYLGHDIEGLDVHPHTHQLYASNGKPNARLYSVDAYSGMLTLIGDIGFDDVEALSFHPDGTLWGWARQGLIQIDIETAQGTLVYASDLGAEGISWNSDGSQLYIAARPTPLRNSQLWVYQDGQLQDSCSGFVGEIEGLETHPDGNLVFTIHENDDLQFHLYDPVQCQTLVQGNIDTPYSDIEAIAWPQVNCSQQQQLLRSFFNELSDDEPFIGEDNHIIVTLDGVEHHGQLSDTPPVTGGDGELQLIAIPDANGDGLGDFSVIYPDGTQQTLFYLGTTTP